jgi:hypothetical protein
MGAVALSGNDTIQINNSVLTALGSGNCVELKFPNPIATLKTGKNGNSIYGLNQMGNQCEVTVKVLRGSADDKLLNSLLQQQQSNFAGTVLLIGQFVKKVGNGLGNITSDTYIVSGGIFTKIPEAKTNVEGDSEQSEVMYTMMFSNAPRVLT